MRQHSLLFEHSVAIEQVRSEFINYNRAQNCTLDYLNKTGMTFFMKYFMRKHPIVLRTIKDNPSRAMAQLISANGLGLPSIYDSSLLTKDLVSATGVDKLFGMASGAHPWISL